MAKKVITSFGKFIALLLEDDIETTGIQVQLALFTF